MSPETFIARAGYPDLGWDHAALPYEPAIAASVRLVCEAAGMDIDDVRNAQRGEDAMTARWAAVLFAHEAHCPPTVSALARYFDRDHTTILHTLRRGREHIEDGTERGRRMAAIMAQARAGG